MSDVSAVYSIPKLNSALCNNISSIYKFVLSFRVKFFRQSCKKFYKMGYNEVRKDDYDVIQERMVNLQYVTFIVREDDFQKRHYICNIISLF
jgi:hypothetical protein